jgi:methylmalonyl-CoA mutase
MLIFHINFAEYFNYILEMDEKLFQEFPPIPTQSWEELIHKDLKGGDYDKKLVWKTLEGFPLRPYYREEDLRNLEYLNTNPGNFPYLRGVDVVSNKYIRQDIIVKNAAEANGTAHKIMNAGVSSLGFIIQTELDKFNFDRLMQGIDPCAVEINFISSDLTGKYIEMLSDFAVEHSYDLTKIYGSNDYDSLSYMILNGRSFCGNNSCLCAENMFKEYSSKLPNFKLISVNAKNFHNAGGSVVHELGFGLSIGAEYLRKFADQNVSIDEIASKIRFNFAVGSNYFMEIAKLRASKLLWAKIVEANEVKSLDSAKINIHCETSQWNKTIYDPYVNMLRATTESMSAVLGGTDSLSVLPFDTVYAEPSDFSMRVARNVQIIITEEAHFNKVIDPVAGSYYLENLTNLIIEKAWSLFLEVEEKGGFVAAVKEGFIQNIISETAKIRNSNIASRREIILGVNQYPNFNEFKQEVNFSSKAKVLETDFPVITLYRGAEEFEKLRLVTEKSGKRPVVFMLTIGNLNFRKARAQFSANFFACAGFEVIDNNGFDSIDQGLAAAEKRNADIIVICSSDEEYETLAPEAFEKISGKILVIAGSPACKTELETKGIKNFIHVRSNVLADLKYYQQVLGIN